jgi:hypothetical protein
MDTRSRAFRKGANTPRAHDAKKTGHTQSPHPRNKHREEGACTGTGVRGGKGATHAQGVVGARFELLAAGAGVHGAVVWAVLVHTAPLTTAVVPILLRGEGRVEAMVVLADRDGCTQGGHTGKGRLRGGVGGGAS